MPYRPGLPLDEVIRRIDPASRPRDAMSIWKILVEGSTLPASEPSAEIREDIAIEDDGRGAPRGDGWDGFPVRGTYAQGASWIVMVVARALAYAHSMRTFHRDVKPGNVLMTLHHGPQLLDFNLAESPHSASEAAAAMHGGTLPYMAPEQIEAFLDPQLWGRVGAKADVYSLGLVLRELLTGERPELPAEALSPQRAMRVLLDRKPLIDVTVRRFNPAIPHALEAIVAKCLAVSPEDRYPGAQALAEDLDRFLNRLPLVCATNPSRPERLANWGIRHRWAMATHVAYLLVIGALSLGVVNKIKEWTKPRVETVAGFLDAVRDVDNDEFGRAERPLRSYVAEYPESFLPKIYLTFVLDGWEPSAERPPNADLSSLGPDDPERRKIEAQELFEQALKSPDFRKEMLAWGRSHPKLASQLEEFGKARFTYAYTLTEKAEYDREMVALDRKRLFKRAQPALEIAAELDPNSPVSSRFLANIDEADQNYRSAFERISPPIDAIRAAGIDAKREKEFYASLVVCGRIATRWADQLRGEPATVPKALDLLRQAVLDLEDSEKHELAIPNNSRRIFYVLGNKFPAFLTLCEIEAELGKIPDARDHLRTTRDAMDRVERVINSDLSYRHILDLPVYRQRAAKVQKRLHDLEAARGPRVEATQLSRSP